MGTLWSESSQHQPYECTQFYGISFRISPLYFTFDFGLNKKQLMLHAAQNKYQHIFSIRINHFIIMLWFFVTVQN